VSERRPFSRLAEVGRRRTVAALRLCGSVNIRRRTEEPSRLASAEPLNQIRWELGIYEDSPHTDSRFSPKVSFLSQRCGRLEPRGTLGGNPARQCRHQCESARRDHECSRIPRLQTVQQRGRELSPGDGEDGS
jgi:hypothetical protein